MARGVLVLAMGPSTVRACCHHQVTNDGVKRAIVAFREAAAEVGAIVASREVKKAAAELRAGSDAKRQKWK